MTTPANLAIAYLDQTAPIPIVFREEPETVARDLGFWIP